MTLPTPSQARVLVDWIVAAGGAPITLAPELDAWRALYGYAGYLANPDQRAFEVRAHLLGICRPPPSGLGCWQCQLGVAIGSTHAYGAVLVPDEELRATADEFGIDGVTLDRALYQLHEARHAS